MENPRLCSRIRDYEMPEHAHIQQVTTAGFPQPLFRCEGIRRRRGGSLFNVKVQVGIKSGPLFDQQRRWISSKQTTSSQAVKKPFRRFFSHLEFAVRHFFEWPHLAENRWPHDGRKLTGGFPVAGDRPAAPGAPHLEVQRTYSIGPRAIPSAAIPQVRRTQKCSAPLRGASRCVSTPDRLTKR